ncbi:MAG: hypothetical protein O9341_09100 [Paucibacter sp.]|nr:hypothetical protein [Roseateles sp.]
MSARRRRISLQRIAQRRQHRADRRVQQRQRAPVTPRHDVCFGMDLASGPDRGAVNIVFLRGDYQSFGTDANDRRFWVVRP